MSEVAYDVSVVSSGHDVADARLHRIVHALRARDLTVQVLALGHPKNAPAGADFEHLGNRAGLGRRALDAFRAPWLAGGRVLVTLDPDLVIPAWVATRLRRRRLVVDLHEDYAAMLADRSWARGSMGGPARLLVRATARTSKYADITSVADDHIPPLQARRRLVVRNTVAAPTGPTERDAQPRAFYVGDVRTSRGLRTMVDAIRSAPPWTLDVVGPVAPDDADWISVADLGDRIRLHGRLPPERAWEIGRGAWVGLALLEDTPAFRAAVPTKVYEYLGAGLAVLATPLPRLAALLEESEGGALVGDAREASTTLQRWSADPEELDRMRAAGSRWAARCLAGPTPFDMLAAEIRRLLETEESDDGTGAPLRRRRSDGSAG